MKHPLFKPKTFEEGQHAVVGNCNGMTMEERYKLETPLFAKKIASLLRKEFVSVLDYGCGVGRLSKGLLEVRNEEIEVVGCDDSEEMRKLALANVSDAERFKCVKCEDISSFFRVVSRGYDLCILVYVLQHIPAIQIRETLQRIHYHLNDGGILFYCSSDYRMAINFNGGFYDDRHLGVNLQEELSRYFDLVGPAFSDEEINQHEVLRRMIRGDGGLAHPALIYKKKKIEGPLFNAKVNEMELGVDIETEITEIEKVDCNRYKVHLSPTTQKLILIQKQAPGDIMMSTCTIRDLHKAYPGKYITDVRTPCNEIFANNPYITPIQIENKNEETRIIEELKSDDKHPPIDYGDVKFVNLHYPSIHRSGVSGEHFSQGETQFLEQQLGVRIPQTSLRPELYLDQNEINWPSPVTVKTEFEGKYWVINAGSKQDYSLKQYPYYQQVVDYFVKDAIGKFAFVQIGQTEHTHIPLNGTISMVGKTNLRELIRLIYHAEGVLTCVSVPMHIAAAFSKPCVVVAGGREGTRWELYPDHRFLYTNGTLDCCRYDGCWKSKPSECAHFEDGVARCMKLIRPRDIAWAILMYYEGGVL